MIEGWWIYERRIRMQSRYMLELEQAGINVNNGLLYSNQEESFYIELLTIFLEEYEEKSNRLKEKKDDLLKYRIIVHDLKSNCKALGMDELSDLAFEHEKACKRGDQQYIQSHIHELCKMWKGIKETVEKVIT